MTRRIAVAALVAATVALPLAGGASAVCESVSTTRASAGYCDESPYWSWCAGVGVTGVAGVGACRPTEGPGLWVGCWTFQGLHCN